MNYSACCAILLSDVRYKCDSCFNFDLCECCYVNDVELPSFYVAHKDSHTFTRISKDSKVLFPPVGTAREVKDNLIAKVSQSLL